MLGVKAGRLFNRASNLLGNWEGNGVLREQKYISAELHLIGRSIGKLCRQAELIDASVCSELELDDNYICVCVCIYMLKLHPTPNF